MTNEIQIASRKMCCGICFRPIEKGAEFTYAPFGRSQLAVVAVHPKCKRNEKQGDSQENHMMVSDR